MADLGVNVMHDVARIVKATLRPPGSSKAMLTPSDFTSLGAFVPPGALAFGAGLGVRDLHGDGSDIRLYGIQNPLIGNGGLLEYQPVADNLLSNTGSGFTAATVLHTFGDIWQSQMQRDVTDGAGGSNQPPPTQIGIAKAGLPQHLYWDPLANVLYWFSTISYNNTTTTSDQCIGYSTLDDVGHTGTGVGMWKLSPIANYGNRWCFQGFPIPASFASAYCGGKRLGVGCGGTLSIISNGPPSIGSAAFAINPPVDPADPNHDYIQQGLVQLLNYPATSSRAPRPAAMFCNQQFGDGFDGRYDLWNGWIDAFSGCAGWWIEGPQKHGFFTMAALATGFMNTTILGSPTPTHTVFSVAAIGDAKIGDYIKWATTGTVSNPDYPFSVGTISNVSGSQITVTGISNGDPLATPQDDPSWLPIVGGMAYLGAWYQGGGLARTRVENALTIYDPADLALVAQGSVNAQRTPSSIASLSLPGQVYPFPGGGPNAALSGVTTGIGYVESTKRLYVLFGNLPNMGTFGGLGLGLVYVFSVNC